VSKGRAAAIDRLKHMSEAADSISEYASRGRDAFDKDPAVRDAILYQVVILGEAAKAALKADPSLETELPAVEWSPIARMRDLVTHHYWTADRELVWSTATVDVPHLKTILRSALTHLK
jgi:uncharacterized protein with HEPN domain